MVKSLLGLAWCVAVLAAYYANNTGYYAQKICEFGGFLLGIGN